MGKQEILNICYFLGAFILIEYQFIMLVYWFIYKFALPEHSNIILNPVFLCFILVSMLSIEELVKLKLAKLVSAPENTYIKFTSDRIKVSLEVDSILFIESKDYEVSVMTVSGKAYSTRMRISQWESVLDDRFLRVHRSFIINIKHITTFNSKTVYINDLPVEISRKYKTFVMQKLGNPLNA
jgi:DNA-binding LytR/AlgR family response regulator